MGLYSFKLPDVGEGIAESEIAAWRVKVGESISEDQPLVDMLTEKAAVEIPSPVNGVVVELRGQEGDKVAVGSVLVIIDTQAGVSAAEVAPAAVAVAAPSAAVAAKAVRPHDGSAPRTSPAVRKLARELGIDLYSVAGSGPRGRILRDDVQAATSGGNNKIPFLPSSAEGAYRGTEREAVSLDTPQAATREERGAVQEDAVEAVRIIGMRRKIAEAMQRSKQRIPHFSYVEEVDVTELEALRVHLNELHGKTRGKLTVLPFLMRALVKLRPRFPQVNANYDDEAGVLYRHKSLHVGIAAQTPQGLVVPVVHRAETLDLWRAAGEIRRLAEAARSGKAKREELSGSTITITSLGAMGGIASTPVINAPEVAIVGINKMVARPMIRDGAIVPRLMMNLSSSFDHRIVDGYDAAEFIQAIKALLEHPATLFID
jgi:2-oxoisovalerate dehydrogenase E2 component (dihydrolipoyl transacylase)